LVQVLFSVVALLSRVAAEHGLSLTQLRVLAILRDREPKMAELAAHLGLERSSVSGLSDRAETRARAARRQRRRRPSGPVSLTPDGRRLAAQLTEEVSGLIAPM